jgi:hypothetical protein
VYCHAVFVGVFAGGSRKARAPSKRILLSLRLKSLLGSSSSSGSSSAALVPGQVVPAVVKSVEDRGYSLTFGVKVSSWVAVVHEMLPFVLGSAPAAKGWE